MTDANNKERWDGEIAGKRAQLRRALWTGKTEVYREYSDEPGLFQFLGHYEDLKVSNPTIAETVRPFVESFAA